MRLILMFIYLHLTYIPSFHHFRIQSLIFRWHPRSLHRHIHPQFVRGGLLDRSGSVWNNYAEEIKTMIDIATDIEILEVFNSCCTETFDYFTQINKQNLLVHIHFK